MFRNLWESFLYRLSRIVQPLNLILAERLRDKSEERAWKEFHAWQKMEEEKEEERWQQYNYEICLCGHTRLQHAQYDYCCVNGCDCSSFMPL